MEQQTTKSKNSNRFFQILCVVLLVLLLLGVAGIAIFRGNNEVKNGLSAYELAVQYGYEGSVQEWLDSLSGKSAYQIAVDNGYSGTEKDWTSALEASAKQENAAIKTAAFSSNGELLITLSDNTVLNIGKAVGADGKDGSDGKDGLNGTNGKDGINGINGKNGIDGKDGVNGKNGADGTNGKNGENGSNGIGITNADVNSAGQLILTFSDGKTVNLDIGFYMLIGLIFAIILVVYLFAGRGGSLSNIKSKTTGDGQFGTAKWASKDELRRNMKYVPYEPEQWRAGENSPKN